MSSLFNNAYSHCALHHYIGADGKIDFAEYFRCSADELYDDDRAMFDEQMNRLIAISSNRNNNVDPAARTQPPRKRRSCKRILSEVNNADGERSASAAAASDISAATASVAAAAN